MNMRSSVRLLSALLALAAPLAACHSGAGNGPPPLEGAALGGPFALTDQNGRAVTDQSYAGRYRAIYFGYSYCPDVCPTTLQTLMQAYHSFAGEAPDRAARLVPIFITIDPDRDTPAVLRQYVSAFGPELQGLTGSPQEIAKVAREYAVSYSKQPAPKGASGYLMSHSSVAILYGPDGKPITTLPTEQGAAAVAETLRQWVR